MYYSVIIVEDEPLLRSNYKEMVPWEEYQCKVVFDCAGMEQAMQYMTEHGFPEILMTDIHLIQESGIELCRWVQRQHPETKKIIMSGYDYFEYAQKAIRYGVTSYLLKPMNLDEVHIVLTRLTEEILKERYNQEQIEKLKRFIPQNRQALIENFLVELSGGSYALRRQDYESFSNRLQWSLKDYYYVVIRYRTSEQALGLEIKLQLKDFFTEQFSFYGECYSFTMEHEKINCVFMPHSRIDIADIVQTILNKVPLFNDSLYVSAGISLPGHDYLSVKTVYEQASMAVGYDFYFGPGSVTQYQDVFEDQKNNPCSYETFESEVIISYLRAGDWQSCLNVLSARIAAMKQERVVTQKAVQITAIELVTIIYNSIYANHPQLSVPNMTDDIYRIAHATTLDETESVLADIISTCGKQIQTRFLNHTHTAVTKIMNYLDEHYQEPISLEDLSKVVFLNTKYICNIIKQDTGKTFHEILVGLRIQKAKALMKLPNSKMYEISQQVGFSDSKSFNNAFKKVVGMTPTEYRNQLSETAI